MTVRKTMKFCLAIVLLLSLTGGGYAYWVWSNANRLLLVEVREKIAELAPGWNVHVESARFDWNRRVHLYGVTVTVDGAKKPFVRIPEVVLVVDREQLADEQEFLLRRVQILQPEISLIRDEQGRWNWQKLPPLPKSKSASTQAVPEVKIVESTVQVLLRQAHGEPTAQMKFRPTDAHFVPSGKRNYAVTVSTQIGETGTVSVNGDWNIDSRTWAVKGRVEEIRSSGELLGLAVGASPELRRHIARLESLLQRQTPVAQRSRRPVNADALPDFGASGTLNLDFEFSRKSLAEEPAFNVTAEIQQASIVNAVLPFPLHRISGKIHWDNRGVTLKDFRAQNGQTQLMLNGNVRRLGTTTPCRLDLKIVNLPLDERLESRLPASWKAAYDSIQPTGKMDVTGTIRYDGRAKWSGEQFLFTFNDCTGAHVNFPYRVRQVNGQVKQHPDNLFKFHFQGMAGRQRTTLTGFVRDPGKEWEESLFDMAVQHFPLDDTFLSACQPDVRKTLRSMGFKGVANAYYRISRLKQNGTNQSEAKQNGTAGDRRYQSRHQVIADIHSGSIEYENFPYRMTGLSGRVSYDSSDETWQFSNVQASNGTARFGAKGTLSKQNGQSLLKLAITSKNAHFDNELRRALPESLQKAWAEIAPKGRLDFSTNLRWASGFPVSIALSDVAVTNGSLSLKAFPYPLNRVRASLSYSNGTLDIHSFRGQHEDTLVGGKGRFEFAPDGEWKFLLAKFYADDIVPDRRFRSAFSKDLRTVVEELDPKKPISVSGKLELRGTGKQGDPVTAAWDLKFLLSGNTLKVGLPVKNIHGHITARGTWDGRRVEMLKGNRIDLDSASVRGYQFTKLRGPYQISGKKIVIGSEQKLLAARSTNQKKNRAPLRPVRQSDRLTARAIGGEFTLDGLITLNKEADYQLLVTMNKARLEKYAQRYLRSAEGLAGVMYGRVNLFGKGEDTRKITGQGKLLISPAALYELPVVAQMFQVMNFVPPNKTAFKFVFTDFQIANQQVLFHKIDLVGDAVNLRGRGIARFDQKIAFDFYSMMPRHQLPIPILSELVSTATNAWIGVDVRGTTSKPVTKIKAVPHLDNALKGFLRALGTSPMSPAQLTPPQARR